MEKLLMLVYITFLSSYYILKYTDKLNKIVEKHLEIKLNLAIIKQS